jgi:hypothetical protein
MAGEGVKAPSLKQRAARETEEYLVIASFLGALLGALTAYRRLLMSEVGVPWIHYGYAVIQALVLAKIILIGEALHVGERYESRPLIVFALYKSVVYGLLTFGFHILEHVVHALATGESPGGALARLAAQPGEICAYSLVLFVAFVPFFSLQAAGRLLGEVRFLDVLLKRPPG